MYCFRRDNYLRFIYELQSTLKFLFIKMTNLLLSDTRFVVWFLPSEMIISSSTNVGSLFSMFKFRNSNYDSICNYDTKTKCQVDVPFSVCLKVNQTHCKKIVRSEFVTRVYCYPIPSFFYGVSRRRF